MLHEYARYDLICPCNQPCCGNRYLQLVMKRLLFARETHYFAIVFLFVMSILTTTVVVWRLCHMSETTDPLWFLVLDFCIDVIVILEVVFGMTYLGRDYWESNLNKLDFAIATVCVVNVICFFAPFDEKNEDLGKSVRILRDFTRFLRLFFFLRWFSTSMVKMVSRDRGRFAFDSWLLHCGCCIAH
jgi:hypothetical protein